MFPIKCIWPSQNSNFLAKCYTSRIVNQAISEGDWLDLEVSDEKSKQKGIHNYPLLCVALSLKILMKYTQVCGCNIIKCGKVQYLFHTMQTTIFD